MNVTKETWFSNCIEHTAGVIFCFSKFSQNITLYSNKLEPGWDWLTWQSLLYHSNSQERIPEPNIPVSALLWNFSLKNSLHCVHIWQLLSWTKYQGLNLGHLKPKACADIAQAKGTWFFSWGQEELKGWTQEKWDKNISGWHRCLLSCDGKCFPSLFSGVNLCD